MLPAKLSLSAYDEFLNIYTSLSKHAMVYLISSQRMGLAYQVVLNLFQWTARLGFKKPKSLIR